MDRSLLQAMVCFSVVALLFATFLLAPELLGGQQNIEWLK